MLTSQADDLRDRIQRLEHKLGSDAPILAHYRARLRELEDARLNPNSRPGEQRFVLGMRGFSASEHEYEYEHMYEYEYEEES